MAKITPSRIPPPTRTKLPSGLGVVKIVTDAQGNNLLLNTDDGIVFPLTDMVDTNIMSLWKSNSTVLKVVDEINNAALEAIGSPRKRNIPKVEKLFSQPKELFEVVDFTSMGIIEEPKHLIPKFIEGEKYALKGIACDGFDMEEKVYELVGVVDEFEGVKIDSVIVKQVDGEKGLIFTLSKNDCAHLGIEYQAGLQLFPKNLSWRKVKEVVPFDKHNLGTTPLSDIDNTIRYVLIKLNGFKDFHDGLVQTPSGNLIKEKQFERSIRVHTIEPVVYGNGCIIQDKTNLNVEIVYPNTMTFNHGNFISSEDSVFLLINFRKPYDSPLNSASIDGLFGIEQKYFEGVDPNEYFIISWDELGSITVEEYEAEKRRKAEEAAERARKEEEERQRRIAEEERKLREKKKRAENAIFRMKSYNLKMPSLPAIPSLKIDGSVASVDMVASSINGYFKSLDSSIKNLTEDLDMMFKLSGLTSTSKRKIVRDDDNMYELLTKLSVL